MMVNFNLKKIIVILLAACIITSFAFSGCVKTSDGGKKDQENVNKQTTADNSDNKSQSEEEQPYEFSIFRSTWTDLDEDNDLIINEINKKLNLKIRILTAPYETWIEKYNILITSGDVPDLSVTTGPGTMNFDDWAKQGIFLDIKDLYEEHCPNIQKYLNKDIIDAHLINGGLYGIPKPSLSDSTFAIRADWLKKLNIAMPKTLDDVYQAVKSFRDNDPDGNNKNDTYGLCSEDTLNTINFVFSAFGVHCPPTDATKWVPDGSGKLTSNILEPGVKDAIIYVTKLYRDKILDQEWMLTKSQAYIDKVQSGKAGILSTGFGSMLVSESNIKANDPACELAIMEGITGPEGKFVRPMQNGFYMVSSISSEAENPVKILEFLDFLMSDEGDKLIRYGIEGVTYAMKDGKPVVDMEAAKKYGIESGHKFRQILQPPVISIAQEDPRVPELLEKAKVLYEGPFYPAPTLQPNSLKEVTTQQGPDYVKNAVTKIITGDKDPGEEWDKFIEEWKKTGGDKLIQEINELYEANK